MLFFCTITISDKCRFKIEFLIIMISKTSTRITSKIKMFFTKRIYFSRTLRIPVLPQGPETSRRRVLHCSRTLSLFCRRTTPRPDRDADRDGGPHVVGRAAGGHLRRGAPRTRGAGREAAGEQRGPGVRAAGRAARPAAVLCAWTGRGRRRRPVARRGRVQRARRRRHVPRGDADDAAGPRRRRRRPA